MQCPSPVWWPLRRWVNCAAARWDAATCLPFFQAHEDNSREIHTLRPHVTPPRPLVWARHSEECAMQAVAALPTAQEGR